MEKLDRLGWAAGISFSAFGVRIGVRVSAEDLLEPVASHLPIGWKPEISSTVERLYSVVGGGEPFMPMPWSLESMNAGQPTQRE
jgi:hypothetical protein